MRRIVSLSLSYLLAYFIASYLDLYTTLLALQRPGTSEGNVYSTSGHDYIATKAWLITFAGAVFIEAFLLFGALNARRVSEHWLRHPLAARLILWLRTREDTPNQAVPFRLAQGPESTEG